jgi:thymidylate kinase
MLPPPPAVLLILGTDAAGKDYVADFLIRRWQAAGYAVEKRAGRFSASAVDDRSSSERKGRWGRFQEQVFLNLFPLLRPLLPAVAWLLLARDRRRVRPSAVPLVVVSHTALRLLALVLGQQRKGWAALACRPALERALRAVLPPDTTVVVLDVAPATRHRRIAARIRSGTVDPFDRYMIADPDRAERIERCLVELATRYLNAAVIENDDLDDAALERELAHTLGRPAPFPSP